VTWFVPSKLERRDDVYVSTLQDFVRALGGELKITAKVPEGTVEIRQFEERDGEGVGAGQTAALVEELAVGAYAD